MTPRWVKLSGLVAVGLVIVVVALHLMGVHPH
jgi:hypothetical protein